MKKMVSFLDVVSEVPAATVSIQPVAASTRSLLNVPIHSLILIWSYFAFGLTRDVAGTMARTIPSLILLQVGYAYVLLGQNSKPKKKAHSGDTVLVVASLFVALVASLPLFTALLLFGAPMYDHMKTTYLLALHLSFLVVYPMLVVYQYDLGVWSRLVTFDVALLARNPVYVSAVAGLIGAWLGVMPIPLDWDRPWQAWPITLLVGSYVGNFMGGIIHYLVY